MKHKQINKFYKLNDEARGLLKTSIQGLGFSARAYDKILKVARAISVLAGSEDI